MPPPDAKRQKNTVFFNMLFVKIDEHRCTVVQNRPCRPPAVRPSARRPPVLRPSVRPLGPGPAEPIYIKLPIDRHGRLLLVLNPDEAICLKIISHPHLTPENLMKGITMTPKMSKVQKANTKMEKRNPLRCAQKRRICGTYSDPFWRICMTSGTD